MMESTANDMGRGIVKPAMQEIKISPHCFPIGSLGWQKVHGAVMQVAGLVNRCQYFHTSSCMDYAWIMRPPRLILL